ncbi:MAG TPA: alpha/beta hydrolase [Thermoplasmata archaeon]|nr:alpha/beta hydrolase [Thermoplasmata archaeon]
MPRLRRITTASRRSFEYVARGKGPATLLVHPGGPGLTYHYLRPLLRLANAHLRVILFNPRGVGGSWSPRRTADFTIANLAEDVEALRKAFRISELHLLGFSAGGFVALEYAHRYQEKLRSLLLCGTAGSAEEIRSANRTIRLAAPERLRRQLAAFEKRRAFDDPEYRRISELIAKPFNERFLDGGSPDLRATKLSERVYRAMMTRTGDEFAVDGTMARWDGRRYYARIEVPTLVLVGHYDFFLEASVEMSDRIVPAHLRVIPRASHLAPLEQPREFLKMVREFLVDVTGD